MQRYQQTPVPKFRKKIIDYGDRVTFPVKGQQVIVHYTGTLMNGQKFDSSVDRDEPFSFTLGTQEVIKGWDEGVATMSIGEMAVFEFPPEYAYGSTGSPPDIPPNSPLIFQIELLDIK